MACSNLYEYVLKQAIQKEWSYLSSLPTRKDMVRVVHSFTEGQQSGLNVVHVAFNVS